MYGSHPYSTPGQQSSGPSQPEWRRPAPTQSSWRPSTVSPPPPPAPPNPAASAPSYNPNTYGSMTSAPGPSISPSVSPLSGFSQALDTTSWGVRYNHQHPPHHTPSPTPPPLPPRPSSTTGQSYSSAPPPTISPIETHQSFSTPPGYGPPATAPVTHQQWMTNAPYGSQQSFSPASQPPPPPPLPPGYAHAVSQPATQPLQQPPPPAYSTSITSQPVSSQYDTPPQSAPVPPTVNLSPYPPPPEQPPATTAPSTLPTTAPPVPPKMSPLVVSTGASALGSGGPSDWEHLSPVPGDVDDVATFEPRRDPAHSRTYSELPTSSPVAPADTASVSPPTTATPLPNVSPPTQHAHMQGNGAPSDQFRHSPVSPSTSLGYQEPPPPVRVDTMESTYSTASGTGTSESIDKVIEAWKRPVSPDKQPTLGQGTDHSDVETKPSTPLEGPSPLDVSKQKPDGPGEQTDDATNEITSSSDGVTNKDEKKVAYQRKAPDPFEDLDPWSKSSLERYVAMLRKEAVADSDEERYRIFTAFMAKETKLREILYNVDHDQKSDEPSTDKPTPVQESPQPKANEPEKIDSPIESGLIPVETEGYFGSTDVPEETEDGRYSPGGRPILPRLHTPISATSLQRSSSVAVGAKHSHGLSGQIQLSRPTSVPPTMSDAMRKQSLSPLTTNPPNAIYTPFRYAEGPQRGSDNLIFDRPAYQAYSALRQASAESGRMMSNAPAPAPTERPGSVAPSTTQDEDDETFVGLIREKSVAYRNKSSRRISSPPPPLPAALRQGRPAGSIDELRSMVSSPLAKQSESAWHITTKQDLEKYPNDFTYIREAGTSWESANKSRREQLDKERMRRQEESEEHVDALFNEKEIGYADINVLEEEFRQTEARVQLNEEREEVDDFVKTVFKPLETRLTEEISALQDLYESALSQLNLENSRIQDSERDKYNLSHTMKLVNDIYRRLELRYHKRLQIALDLERRRKKAERRPLVFMGDSAELKKVDADFDQMEKQNILRAARDRDERANRLMDAFDEAIIHGLGENQSLLDEILAKVSKIDLAAIRSSGMADSEVEQMFKSVQYSVDSLRQDSENILRYFGLADAALNEADYQVSVAEARCSGADADVFRRLDEEKKKEDAKIQNDLKSKIASVRAGPAKILAAMNDLLKCLGKAPIFEEPAPIEPLPAGQSVGALLPGPRPPTANIKSKSSEEDPEHQERLRRALENAKKRNAARVNPPP